MSERLQSEDEQRAIIREQLLADIALWGVESEFIDGALERATEIIANRDPSPTDDKQKMYQRRYKAKQRSAE